MKNGKAPGPYLIEVIVLKAAILNQLVALQGVHFLGRLSRCLKGWLRVFLKGKGKDERTRYFRTDLSPLRNRENVRDSQQVGNKLDGIVTGTLAAVELTTVSCVQPSIGRRTNYVLDCSAIYWAAERLQSLCYRFVPEFPFLPLVTRLKCNRSGFRGILSRKEYRIRGTSAEAQGEKE